MLTQALEACVGLSNLPPGLGPAYVAAGFEFIGAALGSTDGYVALATRPHADPSDALLGFRVHQLWTVGSRNAEQRTIADAVMSQPDLLAFDAAGQRVAREHGAHRVYRDEVDPRTVAGQSQGLDAWCWETLKLVDQLKGVHSLEANVELVLVFYRFEGQPRFTPTDVALLRHMLPALSLWVRRLALLHGAGAQLEPLTPREQEMMVALLGAEPQKHFATRLNVSAARARELIREVHRKLGTTNRADLQRRWMSDRVELTTPPVDHHRRRRSPTQLER